ncbi:MAG: hypothetical protein ACREGC_01715, partial [Minisyncoccia bacterium]
MFLVFNLFADNALAFWATKKKFEKNEGCYGALEDGEGAPPIQFNGGSIEMSKGTRQKTKEKLAVKKKILERLSNPEHADYHEVI